MIFYQLVLPKKRKTVINNFVFTMIYWKWNLCWNFFSNLSLMYNQFIVIYRNRSINLLKNCEVSYLCVSWRDFLKAWVTGSELWASRDIEPDISIPVWLFSMMIWSSNSLTYSGRSVGFQHLLIVNMINIQEIFLFALYRLFASIFYDIINFINYRTHNISLTYSIFIW